MDVLGALAPPLLTEAFGGGSMNTLPAALPPGAPGAPAARPRTSILPGLLAFGAVTAATAGAGALFGRRDPDLGAAKGAKFAAASYAAGAVTLAAVATPIVLWSVKRDMTKSWGVSRG